MRPNTILTTILLGSLLASLALTAPLGAAAEPRTTSPDADLQDVRRAFLELQRDLLILEEDLLFPASSQVAVYLSMDVGEFFQLDAVTIKLNGKDVAHHLYTERQAEALLRGGVHKLYLGNLKEGSHRLTAVFTGRGPENREYRRGATVEFEKTFEPTFIELAIRDAEQNYQPEFFAVVNQ